MVWIFLPVQDLPCFLLSFTHQVNCLIPQKKNPFFLFLGPGPCQPSHSVWARTEPAQDGGLIIPPRPSFQYAEWILHAVAPEVGGKEKGRRESWGGNLVIASCHGGVHAVEFGERPVVVEAELVATGGGCCLSPPLCRDTGVSFFSFPLLLLFILFPLPRLFSVSSLLVLLFSFLFSSPPLFSPVFLPTLKIPPSCFFVSASVSFTSPKPFLL